jgi:hypothetical protein
MPQTNAAFNAIPQELRDLPRWLLWRAVPNGDKKPRKVPYQANGVWGASTTNPATWCTYEQALAAYATGTFTGIGFVFNGDGLTGIDLDNCYDEDGLDLNAVALDFQGIPGYVEQSPSGNGIHIITRTDYKQSPGKNDKAGLEIYTTERYFTFTGKPLSWSSEIPTTSQDFDGLIEKYLTKDAVAFANTVPEEGSFANWKATLHGWDLDRVKAEILSNQDPSMSNSEWFKFGAALHHQGQGDPEWMDAFDEWSQGSSKYQEGEIEALWQRYNISRFKGKVVTLASYIGKKEAAPTLKANADKPKIMTAAQLYEKLGPISWQIEGYKETHALTMVWGAPGSYKTFHILDWCLAIASGTPWHNAPVKQGPVLYVAGEGSNGLSRRVNGWAEHRGLDMRKLPFHVTVGSRDIIDMAFAKEVIEYVRSTGVHFAEIVIDTLNRNFSGNENDATEVGKALQVLTHIMTELECSITIVHHAIKSGEGYRGSSALKGGMDAEYEVLRTDRGYKLFCHKMKDAPEPAPLEFTVEGDEDCDAPLITLIGQTEKAKAGRPKGTGPYVQFVLDELDSGPKTLKQLKAAGTADEYTGGGADRRKERIKEAVDRLLDDGRILNNLDEYRKSPKNPNNPE